MRKHIFDKYKFETQALVRQENQIENLFRRLHISFFRLFRVKLDKIEKSTKEIQEFCNTLQHFF
jgi:hypothetical protein